MSRTNMWRGVRAAVTAGLALGGYLLFVPVTVADHGQVARLLVARTAVPGVPARAAFDKWVDPSQSTFSATKRAAKRDPEHTGLYAREWWVTSSAPPESGVVLQVLPDEGTARAAEAEVAKQLLTNPTLTGLKAASVEPFSVPGVPGGRGAAFAMTETAAPSKGVIGYAYKTVFRVGSLVVSELAITATSTKDVGPLVTDARAGFRLVQAQEPGFSFVHSRFPLVASIVYAVVALVVVVGSVVVPEWALRARRRRHERRHERQQARARSQYLARGRRAVRGGGAPPWAQTKRR